MLLVLACLAVSLESAGSAQSPEGEVHEAGADAGAISVPRGEASSPVLLAQAPGSVSTVVAQAVPSILKSTQATLLAALARGDVPAAILAYEAHVGRPAPVWLVNLRTAYSAASQTIGKCQEVARIIHTAYTRLGQKPEYIAFKTREKYEFITFDLSDGTSPTITRNGYHVAVKMGDIIRDAYTGPLGLRLSDYLLRLHARRGVEWQVVESP